MASLWRLVTPQKRKYNVSGQIMTEAGIHNRWDGDLFVAMGEPLEGAWAIRLRIKPFINMMWLGAVIMGIGGVWAMFDARYRVSLGQRVARRALKGTPFMGKLWYALPVVVALGLGMLFSERLEMDPNAMPTALADQPLPSLQVERLDGSGAGSPLADVKALH